MVLQNPVEKFIKQDRKKTTFETISFPQGARFLKLQEKKLKKHSKKKLTSVNGYNISDSYEAQTALNSNASKSMSSNQKLIENFSGMYETSETTLVEKENEADAEEAQKIIAKFNEKLDNYNTAYKAYTEALQKFTDDNANWPDSENSKKYGGKTVSVGGDIGYITNGGFYKWYSGGVLNGQKALDQAVKDAQTVVDKLKEEVEENYTQLTELQQTKAAAELEYNDYLKFQELGGDGVCLKDTKSRDLPEKLRYYHNNKKKKKRSTSRQDTCAQYAQEKGLDYVGYQYKTCWGGNNPGTFGTSNDCNRTGKDGSLWGGSWAQNVYRVSEAPQNPDEYDDAIEKVESLIAEKNSELEEAEIALAEAEDNRSKNECWPAQTGESYELTLASTTNKKYDSNSSITSGGTQMSSSDFNPPVYSSTPMTVADTCTKDEFTDQEDYDYVLEKWLEPYKKDLDKASEEFEEVKQEIDGGALDTVESFSGTRQQIKVDQELNAELQESIDKVKSDIDKYEKTKEKIENESQNMATVMGMYEDSYLNATSRSQQYLMWSFLAILIAAFTIIKSR